MSIADREADPTGRRHTAGCGNGGLLTDDGCGPDADRTLLEAGGSQIYDAQVRYADGSARWRHPTRGPTPPADFIPVAERSGLIIPLGRWVLDQACRQASRWQRDNPQRPLLATHVNVSAHQLREPEFAIELRTVLAETGLDPTGLVIEITETAMADDPASLETLCAVRELGVRVALDDFGTGQSSLAILANCPVDLVKVDKSFVDHITGSDRHAAVARAVVELADILGIEAIVEGVETAEQARLLHDMGYRQAQGFHFARPLAPSAVDRLLN